MRFARALVVASLVELAVGCGGASSGGSVGYTLSISLFGGGSVAGNPAATSCRVSICSTSLPGGTTITLTPLPATGYVFSSWSGACSGSGTCSLTLASNVAVAATFMPIPPSGGNVVILSVNGTNCRNAGSGYVNKPCVSVTVCLPGTSSCALVDDIMLDTGSYGLRVFKQALPFSLPLSTIGSATIAECIQYSDGASDWGPVALADVVLGGEPTIQIPVQVIDATFGTVPSSCTKLETSPAAAGYQGILGVGPFAEDCGGGCATNAANGIYFACSGGTCAGTTISLASQVPNPVARLPTDNNGVIVDLPSVAMGGELSIEGSLILGIDTRANNSSSGATAYPGSSTNGEILTSFAGSTGGGFLDTGSNGLFFDPPPSVSLPNCAAPEGAWYCPAQVIALFATNSGTGGLPSGVVSFSIGNAMSLFATPNEVFRELGGSVPQGSGFDFGLPFFLGQKVYVGIDGKTSSLGAGPYFAY
jgi:hypothetical protein